MIPFEPLFVNRERELAEFDVLLEALASGRRRHLALLGLRRIGKTMLLDEVRHRHPGAAIVYLALDEIVSTPEAFAGALASETLRAATVHAGRSWLPGLSDDQLRATAQALHPRVLAAIDELLHLRSQREPSDYGALLAAAVRLPSVVSEALDLPLVVMLDEFQEIIRLRVFPNTENLLGAVRGALDRRGRVAFVVAGSRVTALRALLNDGDSPLFTRFEQLDLLPFTEDSTHDLATRFWEAGELVAEPDAATRLHRLSGGWPFYVQAVAARATQMARVRGEALTADVVDDAFWHELVGRAAALGQQCRYLLDTALRGEVASGDAMQNTLEAVLRQVARGRTGSRTVVARTLRRHHAPAQVYRAINRLIDTDFLREEGGRLVLLDPVFALWLALEPARRDPAATLRNLPARQRLLAWYEAQHARDREELGVLFERQVENVVRQCRGQTVEGRLFGTDQPIRLPHTREASKLRVEDPQGQYGVGPDSYEVDIVTRGESAVDCWAIEAKHRRGAITRPMVERFLRSAQVVATARGLTFAERWIVAPRGIRPDALALAQQEGILASGRRQLERLERLVAQSLDTVFSEAT
jgi:hypothetical protein